MQKTKNSDKSILIKDIFIKARTILTLYYVTIMFIILMMFSGALVFIVESKIHDNFKNKTIIIEDNEKIIKKASNDIEFLIYASDGFLLVVIALSSYFLAGQTLKPIKQTLESQKKFLADASHDLRTPIAIIITDSEVTLDNQLSDIQDFKRLALSNLEEARKMNLLVNDLLILARAESINKEKSKVYLSLLLNNVIDKMQSQIEIKNLKLERVIEEDIFININKEDIERVVKNILQNAINYTKVGHIKVILKKETSVFNKNSKIVLEIVDTGVGIKATDIPFVFDRFYKAEHSRNDGAGSGLGLPIAREIIEKNGGNISIESKENIGTKVYITL